MKAFQLQVRDLTEEKRGHLAWRLDHKTACGYLTACRIGRGELLSDKTLLEIFTWAGASTASAKIQSAKVLAFRPKDISDEERLALLEKIEREMSVSLSGTV